jgi:23S rRNA (cytidine1920-2'-O)/16S rRNA (cytidine1409-2'-O)-methyltransferase
MSRARADVLLVARGLFESRARAQAAIAAGLVSADGAPVRKASEMLAEGAELVASAAHPYVSRGGVKLAAALDAFGVDPAGRCCLDVGASTGGFTDVLLRRGALHVTAIDSGSRQLHASLRGRPAIASLEGMDIRSVDRASLPCRADLAVVDVSFIPLSLVLPAVSSLLEPRAELIALVKPQFEVGKARIGKKGLVKDEAARAEAVAAVRALVEALGWRVAGTMESPIAGGEGAVEHLLGAARGAPFSES